MTNRHDVYIVIRKTRRDENRGSRFLALSGFLYTSSSGGRAYAVEELSCSAQLPPQLQEEKKRKTSESLTSPLSSSRQQRAQHAIKTKPVKINTEKTWSCRSGGNIIQRDPIDDSTSTRSRSWSRGVPAWIYSIGYDRYQSSLSQGWECCFWYRVIGYERVKSGHLHCDRLSPTQFEMFQRWKKKKN